METPLCSITHAAPATRIDRLLTAEFPQYSRTYFQQLIFDKKVMLNGLIINKSSTVVKPGDVISLTFSPTVKDLQPLTLPTEDMGIRLLHEHADFLIVYKPAGILVHAPHHSSEIPTLVDWLVHSFKELSSVGYADRPGIVHRLDKDTSGILIIPRNNSSHAHFSRLFSERRMSKKYVAVVEGHPPKTGTIDYAITRHPRHKHKMTHTLGLGRESVTHYEVQHYFPSTALVEVHPVTGRTHQIRVHMAAIGHPIHGDSVYGTPSESIPRQALHAYQLSFTYQDMYYSFWYDMPHDMKALIDAKKGSEKAALGVW